MFLVEQAIFSGGAASGGPFILDTFTGVGPLSAHTPEVGGAWAHYGIGTIADFTINATDGLRRHDADSLFFASVISESPNYAGESYHVTCKLQHYDVVPDLEGGNRGPIFSSNADATEYYGANIRGSSGVVIFEIEKDGSNLVQAVLPAPHDLMDDFTITVTVDGGDIVATLWNDSSDIEAHTFSWTESAYVDADHKYFGIRGGSKSLGDNTTTNTGSGVNVLSVGPTAPDTTYSDTVGVSGLAAWYDATKIDTLWQDRARTIQVASNLDPVRAWDDATGNGFNVLQCLAAAAYKTGVQNSLPGILGSADACFLNPSSPITDETAWTVFVVFNTAINEHVGGLWCDGNTSSLRSAVFGDSRAAGPLMGYLNDSTGANRVNPTPDYDTAFKYITFSRSGSALTGNLDGVAMTGATIVGDGNVANDAIRLFSQHSAANPLNGHICEVRIYNGVLSGGNISTVEAYIVDKWYP